MRKLLLLAILASAVVAADAQAATNAPAGNSGLAQYLEVVPGSGGDVSGKGGASRNVLSTRTRSQLNDSGDLGRSLVDFTSKTAPSSGAGGDEDSEALGKLSAFAAGATGGGAPGGMGAWLPAFLLAGAALAVYAAYRQKSSQPR